VPKCQRKRILTLAQFKMSQICLMDFQEGDRFSSYFFESDYVQQISFESDEPNEFGVEIWEMKKILSTKRIPTKKGLEFCVLVEVICKNFECSWSDIMKEKTEAKAIDTFIGLKEEMEFFKKKQEEGRLFDGRRYFWSLTKEGKAINGGWE